MAFLLAAVGGAVGFANFWRFPSLAGENGGGAFIIVYIGFVLLVGIPIMAAELILGQRGRGSPVASMRRLVREQNCSKAWMAIGWLSVIGPFCALTYYCVVASWCLDFMVRAATRTLASGDPQQAHESFAQMLDSPMRLLLWHGIYMAATIAVAVRGLNRGLEWINRIMMPSLFVILLFMVVYAMIKGDFAAGLRFMFEPDFSKLTLGVVFMALGQACFSLSVGGGYLLTYSAYLPEGVSLPWASVSIGVVDTAVAILAGLAIFPIVFAFGLPPNSGPGLMFETLPVAFSTMSLGALVGTLFFLLLTFAAFTSSISMTEPVISWLEERPGVTRARAAVGVGLLAWALGIPFSLSFNVLADVRPLAWLPLFDDKGLFAIMDLVVANLILPGNCLLIALFAGWIISEKASRESLALPRAWIFSAWHRLVRYLLPLAIGIVLVMSLKDGLGL